MCVVCTRNTTYDMYDSNPCVICYIKTMHNGWELYHILRNIWQRQISQLIMAYNIWHHKEHMTTVTLPKELHFAHMIATCCHMLFNAKWCLNIWYFNSICQKVSVIYPCHMWELFFICFSYALRSLSYVSMWSSWLSYTCHMCLSYCHIFMGEILKISVKREFSKRTNVICFCHMSYVCHTFFICWSYIRHMFGFQ